MRRVLFGTQYADESGKHGCCKSCMKADKLPSGAGMKEGACWHV